MFHREVGRWYMRMSVANRIAVLPPTADARFLAELTSHASDLSEAASTAGAALEAGEESPGVVAVDDARGDRVRAALHPLERASASRSDSRVPWRSR